MTKANLKDQKQAPYEIDDFIDPENPPKLLPAPAAKPVPESPQNAAQQPDGLVTAFGALFAGSKPYSAKEQGEKTFTVEFYGQEPRTFKARDYAKHYRNQSFREDGRAAADLGGMLQRIELVKQSAEKYLKRVPTAEAQIHHAYNHFAKRHIEFSLAYIAANSSMASAMITGPSNFPVRRQQKLNDRHHNKWVKLRDHIEIGNKSVKRAAFPHGDPREGIRSDNPEAVELLKEKIAKLEANQAFMKKANADTRKARKQADPLAYLIGLEYTPQMAAECLNDTNTWEKGKAFPSYALTNNNANIKRLKGRLATLEKVKGTDTIENTVTLEDGSKIELIRDTEDMRIRLIFEGKPADSIRAVLKKNGFRWSPRNTAWQRHLNGNGWGATKRVLRELGATEIPKSEEG